MQRAQTYVVGALVAALVIAGVVFWRVNRGPDVGPSTSGSSIGMGLTRFPKTGRPALPTIEGALLDGRRLDLHTYRGHVIVLNLWGSWCAPCRAEAPDLVAVANAARSEGVRFVGIDTRDTPAAAAAFVRHYHVPYPSFDDQGGQVLSRFSGIVPISAVPSTVVVDPLGRVVARVVGRVDAKTLQGLIDDVLGEATKASS